MTLGPGLEVRLVHVQGSASHLGIELRFGSRVQCRSLPKDHVETRGRSMWFNDNVWRLSAAGVEFWAANIRQVMKDPKAPPEIRENTP
jgi:hypothetical protein